MSSIQNITKRKTGKSDTFEYGFYTNADVCLKSLVLELKPKIRLGLITRNQNLRATGNLIASRCTCLNSSVTCHLGDWSICTTTGAGNFNW